VNIPITARGVLGRLCAWGQDKSSRFGQTLGLPTAKILKIAVKKFPLMRDLARRIMANWGMRLWSNLRKKVSSIGMTKVNQYQTIERPFKTLLTTMSMFLMSSSFQGLNLRQSIKWFRALPSIRMSTAIFFMINRQHTNLIAPNISVPAA